MKSVIVPVFTDSDLHALPNCLRYLAQQPVENLLVLHGPNVGVVNADATKEHDQRIANLETRKTELKLVDDFAGAQKAKEEIDTLKIERDMSIREGWKKVPEDQRAAAYKKAFAGIDPEPICLREAYQYDQLFMMLQAFLPQWPSDIPMGEFAIVWPRSVPPVAAVSLDLPYDGPRVQDIPIDGGKFPVGMGETTPRGKREQQLRKSKFMGIKSAATKAGVYAPGMSTDQLITAVLDKEFPPEAQAA